ncbi:MAG: SGNH/GDSL hydrolase family protein [Balneolales bacterium]|nr:SGNH/GDSL hydrolase family protein [Balneolales bacterium]
MKKLTTGKKIVFWLITLCFPIVLLGLIEIGLRIGGYNNDAQKLFIEAPNDANFLVSNPGFVGRYFPVFVPNIAPNPFRKNKQPNTFRVFVFGGSSTQGFPYNFYYSFSDQLEQQLLLNTDGVNIEIVNVGMTAVNSYAIRDLSKRVLPYEPDAIIIYAGHNEFYGSFGAATTQFGLINSVTIKRVIIWLKNFRIYQVLEDLLKFEEADSGERRTMMARVVSESNIELQGQIFEQGMIQFEKNMEDVLSLFSKRGVPVYIGTVASNLKDQPPLSDRTDSERMYQEGKTLYDNGDIVSALAKFEEAKELDGIRFRAPNEVNSIIRELADEKGAILVDIEALLRKSSVSGIEDNSLFIDHLHPNSTGHKLIANEFFEHIIELENLNNTYTPNSFGTPEKVSDFEQTYSSTSVSRLLVGYPFKKGLTEAQELASFQKIYDEYLEKSYVDSIASSASRNQRVVPSALTDVINHSKIMNDTLAVVSHYYELLKWQLNSTDLIEKGIEYAVNNRQVDVYLVNMLTQILNDGGYNTRYMDVLSAVYLLNNDVSKARYWLEESEKMGSNSPMFNYNYARFHFLNGDTTQAAVYYNRFINSSQAN